MCKFTFTGYVGTYARFLNYSIALAKCTLWLANKLDLFSRGLHAHVSCLFVLSLGNQMSTLLKIIPVFSFPKRWKNFMILPEVKNIIPLSYEIFSSSFLPGLHLRRFAYLSEELNLLVEQKHMTLGDGQNNNKLVCINFSRLVMHSRNFRENFFSVIWR